KATDPAQPSQSAERTRPAGTAGASATADGSGDGERVEAFQGIEHRVERHPDVAPVGRDHRGGLEGHAVRERGDDGLEGDLGRRGGNYRGEEGDRGRRRQETGTWHGRALLANARGEADRVGR